MSETTTTTPATAAAETTTNTTPTSAPVAPVTDPKAVAALAAVSTIAASQLAGLNDAQRAAVTAIAGDDPTAQLNAISALRGTWGAPASPVIANSGPPARSAPSDNGVPRPHTPSARDIYESIKAENPIQAARYAVQHSREVFGIWGGR